MYGLQRALLYDAHPVSRVLVGGRGQTSMDPVACLPFRSRMPVEEAAFIVHWLSNKEMTYTSKADHLQH